MKRRDLERHLHDHGCRQIDEGANHARWAAPTGKRRSAVPRHREIDYRLARSICKVQKKIGPAWTRRRRPEAGYFTKRTAQAWLDGRLAKAGSGELAGMVRTNLTFEEAAGEWLRYVEHERAVKPGTLKGYRIMVDVLMEDLEGVPIGREPPKSGRGRAVPMMEEVAQALAGHGQHERFTGDHEPNRGPGCRTDAILLQLPTSVVRPAPTAQIGRSPAAEPYDLQRDPAPSAKSLDRGAN